jgi:hypothetical protein
MGQYPVQIYAYCIRAPPQRKSLVKIDADAAVNSGTMQDFCDWELVRIGERVQHSAMVEDRRVLHVALRRFDVRGFYRDFLLTRCGSDGIYE